MEQQVFRSKRSRRWRGERYRYDVGKTTQMMAGDVDLVIPESVFQRKMGRYAKEMGGTYRDSLITLPYYPHKLNVNYLKYPEEEFGEITPYVAWMVYPEKEKNKSKIFRVFSCPVSDSKREWTRFCDYMDKVVKAYQKMAVRRAMGRLS